MFKSRWSFLNINFKAIAGLISCLLIVCFVARSLLPRPLVQLQRLHSALTMSKVAEVESNDQTDTSAVDKPVTISKKVRDEKVIKDLFIVLKKVDFSQHSRSPDRILARFSSYSDCRFLNSCISTIDRPPKV